MKYLVLAFSLLCSLAAGAQSSRVKGTVKTTDGQPVPAVTVSVDALKLFTTTDEDGNYLLVNVKPGTYKVSFKHVGLQTQEKQLTFEAGKTVDLSFLLKENAKQLDEVIVTTDKTTIKRAVSFGKANLSPMDNPQSVGIVSNTVIKDQQVMRLGDVVKNVSGVSITQQRQGVAETFSARGYSIGVGGGTGSIFKNGISSNTGGFPEASTLESVEVMKGSAALLYGNTSAGVVINMVTKKPRFDRGGEVTMNMGSNDLYKPVIDLYGPLSKKIAFRVVGTYEKARSFRDVVHTERFYVNPSFLFKVDNKTTILVQGDYLDGDFTPDNGIGILNQNIDAVIPDSRNRFINTAWAYYHSKTASGSVVIDHRFNDAWKLNVIGAGQDVNINSFGTGVPNAVDKDGNWIRALSRTGSHEQNQTVQLNLTGKFKTGKITHQVLVGTDYVGIKTSTSAYRITSSAGAVGTAYDKINILDPALYVARTDMPGTTDTGRTVSPSYRLGAYAQDLVSITSKWKVLAGLRWSYLETRAPVTYNYVKNTITEGTRASYRAPSPKVALIFEPNQNMSVYGSYTNSFTTNTGTDIYFQPLKPSYIKQYELGWKNILLNGKLAANMSIYRIINSDLAQTAITLADGTPNTNTNIKELTGQTTSDGFDVDLSGTLSKGLYFMAGYGFNNARYTKSTGAKGAVVEGEKLINNPKHTVNGTVFYTFTKTAVKGLKLGISAFYTGKRMGGNQNTVLQTPDYNRQVVLPGFTTLDVSAGYSFKKFSLLAKLSNITNTLNYLVHDRYSVNPIAPRQLMGTLSYKF